VQGIEILHRCETQFAKLNLFVKKVKKQGNGQNHSMIHYFTTAGLQHQWIALPAYRTKVLFVHPTLNITFNYPILNENEIYCFTS
jgi:hypothetical protein